MLRKGPISRAVETVKVAARRARTAPTVEAGMTRLASRCRSTWPRHRPTVPAESLISQLHSANSANSRFHSSIGASRGFLHSGTNNEVNNMESILQMVPGQNITQLQICLWLRTAIPGDWKQDWHGRRPTFRLLQQLAQSRNVHGNFPSKMDDSHFYIRLESPHNFCIAW